MSAETPRNAQGGKGDGPYPYGVSHRKARAKALAEMQDGAPCPFCGRPMYPEQNLDFDHMVPVAVGGVRGERRLSHASCNRRAGARLGNRLRGARVRPAAPRRNVSGPAGPFVSVPVEDL
jgi:hypothetical protein